MKEGGKLNVDASLSANSFDIPVSSGRHQALPGQLARTAARFSVRCPHESAGAVEAAFGCFDTLKGASANPAQLNFIRVPANGSADLSFLYRIFEKSI
jgi:hypothetical protein